MKKLYFNSLCTFLTVYLCLGLLLLVSACEGNFFMVYKQLAHVVLAISIALLISILEPRQLQLLSFILYIIGNVLLICVLLFGHTGKGAQRWLDLGFIRFEPSEILKIALPLSIASIVDQQGMPIRGTTSLLCLLLIGVPFLLISKQPDLGTASITAFIGIATMLIAGFPIRYCLYGLLSLLACSPFLWPLLHQYQQERILTLLLPNSDVNGKGYHIMQAKIAIGSGGVFGKGWMQGTQTHLQYLPEHNTDFIFALCAEEFGFVGCLFLLTVFFSIFWLSCRVSMLAQDTFSRLSCAGISIAFALCSCINIAMVSGMIPVVGIPLPLISYGGTTMVVSMLGFGIVLACAKSTKLFNN